ncbi:hypothetical protein OIU74_014415 [Salix koriyanagi]|uniref:Uncharacterized protein n=1 Tax=Salix koriyanagi TaxID=2511006 RepID=A0A9Q0PW97_9ROSI|nr:hypothetical protein OIU74_014415 [Salix koriyanagi]
MFIKEALFPSPFSLANRVLGVRDGKTRANSLHEAIAAMEMRKLVETAEVQDYYCRSEPKQYQQRGFRGGGDISRSLLNLLLAQNFNVLKGLLRVELTQ